MILSTLADLMTLTPPTPPATPPPETPQQQQQQQRQRPLSTMQRHHHLLHIPKTGGSSLKVAAASCSDPGALVVHPHSVTLPDLRAMALDRRTQYQAAADSNGGGGGGGGGVDSGDVVVLAIIRDPVERFISAFTFFHEGELLLKHHQL